jgi:hypothetical protein
MSWEIEEVGRGKMGDGSGKLEDRKPPSPHTPLPSSSHNL